MPLDHSMQGDQETLKTEQVEEPQTAKSIGSQKSLSEMILNFLAAPKEDVSKPAISEAQPKPGHIKLRDLLASRTTLRSIIDSKPEKKATPLDLRSEKLQRRVSETDKGRLSRILKSG